MSSDQLLCCCNVNVATLANPEAVNIVVSSRASSAQHHKGCWRAVKGEGGGFHADAMGRADIRVNHAPGGANFGS